MNNFYKLLYIFNAHNFMNCNKYLASKTKNLYVSQYLNGLSKPKAFMLSALAGKKSYSDCKKDPPAFEPAPQPCCDKKDDKPAKTCLGDFNIFAENCHWIRQLKDCEADPTFDGEYYNHRMYHKYTYHDVMSHMRCFRLPQPSNKRVIPIAAVVAAMPQPVAKKDVPPPSKKT